MTIDNSGPNFKAKFPFPFFLVIAVVVLFVLYVPMFTRHDVQTPGTEPLLATEPAPLPPNVKTFCHRVAAVRTACLRAHVNCARIPRAPFETLLGNAGLCQTAPFTITPGDAALLLQHFQPEPLCCFH